MCQRCFDFEREHDPAMTEEEAPGSELGAWARWRSHGSEVVCAKPVHDRVPCKQFLFFGSKHEPLLAGGVARKSAAEKY